MAVVVTLTDSQMAVAIKEAERRIEQSRNSTNRTFTGITVTKELNEKVHLLGAVSELAVSLYLKLPWTGKTTLVLVTLTVMKYAVLNEKMAKTIIYMSVNTTKTLFISFA
jgi:hypothetical protein